MGEEGSSAKRGLGWRKGGRQRGREAKGKGGKGEKERVGREGGDGWGERPSSSSRCQSSL